MENTNHPAGSATGIDLAPCPFCSAKMEPFGPAQHNHPNNGCWLASVRLLPAEYDSWNARATPQHPGVPAVHSATNIAWGHELQKRLMAADDQDDDDLHNLLGEAACCLASLVGRPDVAATPQHSVTEQASDRELLSAAIQRASVLATIGMEFGAKLCHLDTTTITGDDYIRLDSVMSEVIAWRTAFDKAPKVDSAAVRAALAIPASTATPIDMILHCPACGKQHIDAPDERTPDWKNEPHRSHLCHGCGHIWRPADVPTNGVKAITTKGKNDSAPASTAASERRIKQLELLAQAYGPKSLQYDIEHPNDGLNSADPKEVERTMRGTAASEQQASVSEDWDKVIVLLNHIENVVDDASFNKIDHNLWNAVTMSATSLAYNSALSGRATIPSEADERASFEAWAMAEGFNCDIISGVTRDTYVSSDTRDLWDAWKARAALPHRATTTTTDMRDAYDGAREDLAIWKRRALEAEASCRRLTAAAPDTATTATARRITAETAQQYMEESLWAFIECAGNYPTIKPDPRIWAHVMACMPEGATTADQQTDLCAAVLAWWGEHKDDVMGEHFDPVYEEVPEFVQMAQRTTASASGDKECEVCSAPPVWCHCRATAPSRDESEGAAQGDVARDAARYRWLRDVAVSVWERAPLVVMADQSLKPTFRDVRDGRDLDAAIDAAMSAPATSGGGNG